MNAPTATMATQFVAGTPASPFLKRVLIPFWVVRILIMVVDLGLYGLAIGVVAAYKDDIDDDVGNTGSTSAALAILVVIELLILTCLVLDIVCIVKRARRTLSPRFFLIVNVIQTLFWTIMFIMGIISTRNGLNVGIGVLLLLVPRLGHRSWARPPPPSFLTRSSIACPSSASSSTPASCITGTGRAP